MSPEEVDKRLLALRKVVTLVKLLLAGISLTMIPGCHLPTPAHPPAIAITSPTNNAVLNVAWVNVCGTFSGKAPWRVTVNRVPAFINGNTFEAMSVPLEQGTNSLKAISEDFAGNTVIKTIMVMAPADRKTFEATYAEGHSIMLIVEPVGGFEPLAVSFRVEGMVPGAIRQVLYDFDGDLVPDMVAHDFKPVTYKYVKPGLFIPSVIVETTAGRFSPCGFIPYRVNVQAPPVLLQTLQVTDPVAIKSTTNGLYVLSGSTATITEFDAKGKTVRSLTGIGSKPSGFDVDTNGNVYVAVSGNNQVRKFRPTENSFENDVTFGSGGFIGNKDGSAGAGSAEFNAPFDVTVKYGFDDVARYFGRQIFVSDSGNNRIQQFDSNGMPRASHGRGFNNPKGIAFDTVQHFLIVNSAGNQLAESDLENDSFEPIGQAGKALWEFSGATHICIGKRGVCVADTGNDRIQIFDPPDQGEMRSPMPFVRLGISGELGLKQPNAATWLEDPLEEKIYIADTGNNRVLLIHLPMDTPENVWIAYQQHLRLGDIQNALACLDGRTEQIFHQELLKVGKKEFMEEMLITNRKIMPVFIGPESAEYCFEEAGAQQNREAQIHFIKENGKWKIKDR